MPLRKYSLSSLSLALLFTQPSSVMAEISAALSPEIPVSHTWMRDVAISPDGQQIAFTYAGQIWLVSSQGGDAFALTNSDTYSQTPIWSPDSQSIAFTSDRYGKGDVFIVPSMGGKALRLTYHASLDVPYAFSADGKQVYFRSARLGDSQANLMAGYGGNQADQLYAVSALGGREKLVLPIPVSSLSVSSDGQQFLYTDWPSYEQEWRKRTTSDAARDIWQFDLTTGKHTQLTHFEGEDRNAVWADTQSMYYLSERSGSFNVWKKDLLDGEPVQITYHTDLPTRFLSVSKQGDLAYGFNGKVWVKSAQETAPYQIDIAIRRADFSDGRHFVNLNSEATEIAVSPVSPEVAIVARGDIYVVSALSGTTKRITDTPATERNISFSDDGYRIIYSSERNGNWDIFQSYVNDTGKSFSTSLDIQEEILFDGEEDEFQPLLSPNEKRMLYREGRNNLKVYDIEQDQTYTLLDSQQFYSYFDGDISYSWSPDSEYIVTRNRTIANSDVLLVKVDGSEEPINLSNSGFSDIQPKFSDDGQIVYWLSDINSLRQIDNMPVQYDVYALFLNQKSQFNAFKNEDQKWMDEEVAATLGSDVQHAPVDPTIVEINGLKHRKFRITPHSLSPLYFHLSPDNKYLVVAHWSGEGVEFSEFNVETGEEVSLFTRSADDVNAIDMTKDGENILIIGSQGIERLNVVNSETKVFDYNADANYDFRAEMNYMFDHVVRLTQSKFYDANLHGINWQRYAQEYKKQLVGITNYQDFAELLSELVGELNASHTGAFFFAERSGWEIPASLGLYYDDHYRGKGIRVKAVLPGGPADTYQTLLKSGSIIYAVDGKEILPEQDIYSQLNFKQGKLTRLTVLSPGEKTAKSMNIVPISLQQEGRLAYELWVEQRRQMVESLSNGRLGYVHMAAMDAQSFEKMQNDMFGVDNNKEALVVDVRFNQGGFLADQMMMILSGQRHTVEETRDGYQVASYPTRRWAKPSIMLADANSYSEGSVVPHFYKSEGIGLLVGERVPGTGTAVLWAQQQEPNLVYGIPQLGLKDVDGHWLENQEVVPDVLVYKEPESVTKGEDKQLKVAVETLLKQLDEQSTVNNP
ncbi:protease [Vibrio aestuarianus]|uniref:S41 family peptidase n=1 Tax=Vibrio aestuarianus TaxID=28171 RepID=UPI0015587852|nr:S41 family peptidase [Vibrio aestuarianus]NGZ14936.1 protease [Vibrio aestuarianus]NKZ51084.1 protease [Vibrio aestuarianus]